MDLAAGLEGLAGTTVVYPRADLADPATSEALRARGATVIDVVAYRNRCPERAPVDLVAALPVHATPLMSGSAARRIAEHVPKERWGELGRIVAIGPSTARVAQSLGLPVYAVASPHTAAGMVAQTARALGIRLSP
jgi:uroporphyrinogen-III synthase